MMTRSMPSALSAAVIGALMLSTAGCSGSAGTIERATPSASSAGSSSAGASSQTPTAGQKDPVDNGAASAGIDPMNPPKPIASLTAPAAYTKDPKAKALIDIFSITRQGRLATLTMAVTPTFDSVDSVSLFTLMGHHTFRPTMVDPINLRKYDVVTSRSSRLSSSETSTRAYSGEAMFIWAVFAAPPANVTKVNLNLFDTVPTIMDVPVQ